jgi:hypothetical protein
MITELVGAGHVVQVGLNPCVRHWLDDPRVLFQKIAEAGVQGVWLEPLHLNSNQTRIMSPKEREALGATAVLEAIKPKVTVLEKTFIESMGEYIRGLGMEPYSSCIGKATNYFAPFRECYEKTFPIIQDVINYCTENEDYSPDYYNALFFDDFWRILNANNSFPSGNYYLYNYIAGNNKTIAYGSTEKLSASTYKELIKLFWSDARMKLSPAHTLAFAQAVEKENYQLVYLVDDEGVPVYLFDRDGALNLNSEIKRP